MFFDFFDKVIVLEDDLEVNKGFLNYMNLALAKYQSDDKVYQISGHFLSMDGKTWEVSRS